MTTESFRSAGVRCDADREFGGVRDVVGVGRGRRLGWRAGPRRFTVAVPARHRGCGSGSAPSRGMPCRCCFRSEYVAQASLYLRDPGSPAVLSLGGSTQSQSGDHAVFMATQAALAGSDEVYGRALQLLKRGGTPDDLRRSVVVAPSADLASITIRATSDDPAEAANLANAVGTAYEQVAGERMAADSKDAITRLQQVMAQREAEFDALRAQAAQASGPDSGHSRAQGAACGRSDRRVAGPRRTISLPRPRCTDRGSSRSSRRFRRLSSSQPAPLLLALFGAVFGLVAAGGWAWWAAGRNRRVEAEGDAGAILGVPLLGETPRLGAKLGWTGGPSARRTSWIRSPRRPTTSCWPRWSTPCPRWAARPSPWPARRPGDGKTVTVLNLALAARREGRKVLLVDADERTRRLSQLCRDGEHFDVIGVSHDGERVSRGHRQAVAADTAAAAQAATRGTVLQSRAERAERAPPGGVLPLDGLRQADQLLR